MFRVVITPEQEMLRNHERARGPRPQPKEPAAIGALEAARLLDQREFMFRGRPYRVPPVPWPLAAELLDVQERLRLIGPDAALPDTLEVFERAARLSKRACRPAGFFRRAIWHITPNPFRQATPWQVGRNLGFFSMCLMLDGDRPLTPAPDRQPGTSRPSSPASSLASRPGRERTAFRSRGATS